jgi:hypothetical protein
MSNVRRRVFDLYQQSVALMIRFPDILKLQLIGTQVEELRRNARAQLREVKVTSQILALALDGSTAEVITESENMVQQEGTVEWYYLTQIVRNESGEYFLLKTTDKLPFIKYLSHSRAKLVLKGKYQTPTAHAAKNDA